MSGRARTVRLLGAAVLAGAAVLGISGGGQAASHYTLSVSSSPDRSSPAGLEGATVSGDIYVFTEDTSTGVSRVRFWLDDPTMSGSPRKSEGNWPHDFNGSTSTGAAIAYDTGALDDGPHTITAAIDLSGGGTEVVSATFTVSNGSEPPPPPPPGASSYTLALSASSDRSSPVGLEGTTVSGDIYVFTEDTSTGVSRVRFWLDDPTMSGSPRKTEAGWPHDFNGSDKASGGALAYDTGLLEDGPHTITAAIDLSSGDTVVVSATFTVGNGSEPPPPPPDPSAYTLVVSASSDRSSPVGLEGATVSGDVYVFTEDTSTGVSRVRFWLDDPTMSGSPRKSEGNWPHDFNGSTSTGAAIAYDTGPLTDGPHTITAEIELSSGDPVVVSATFAVSNGSEPPPPPPGLSDYAVHVSTSPDRSSPVALDGATVSGSIYVFTHDTSTGVTRVRFWLDDPTMTGSPRKTEQNWPHDFNGSTSSDQAIGFDTTGIPDGTHIVTAAIDLSSGGTQVVSASFVVGNAGPPPDDPTGPDQIHLAWVDDPSTTLTVAWRTRFGAAPSVVQYRELGASTWESATGALRDTGTAGTLHETTLQGLSPATVYEYRVNGDDTTIWSDVQVTRTAPPAGPADFDAVYVADTGIAGRLDGLTTGTEQVVDEIAALNPLLVLPGGDYAYYNTDDRFGTLDDAIDAWFNQMQPIATRSPLMPTYGNHEVILGESYDAWADRFPTPAGFDERRNFSFDIGDVHFVSILAVHDFNPIASDSVAWIRDDIQAARARGQRWIIPYFHVSPFADGQNHPSNTALRSQLGPVFEELDVELVLTSHDQAYERTYPLTDIGGSDTPTSSSLTCYGPDDGVVFAKISPGGKISNKNGDFSQFATDPAPAWTAVRDNTMHNYARVVVSKDGWIRLEAYGVTGDGGSPVILDSFEIKKDGCGPELRLDQQSVGLVAEAGESATGTLNLDTTDGSAAPFDVTDDAPWLTVAPASGAAPALLTLTANAATLTAGSYTANVTATAAGYETVRARVTLTVTSSDYELLVSTSADRTNPALLDGQTVSGSIYAFTNPADGVSRVRFWLDDPDMSGSPRKTELGAPHDFAGTVTSSGLAKPFDTGNISNGEHTITAAIDLSTESTIVVHGMFTVAG